MIHVNAPIVGGRWEWVLSGQSNIAESDRYDAFPAAVKLPSGRIVATWSSTTDHFGENIGRVARSDDDGRTWTAPEAHGGAAALATHGARLAALQLTNDGARKGWIQHSTDGGVTWQTPKEITGWGNTGWIFPSDLLWHDDGTPDGLMLVVSYGPDGLILMASTNAGTTWTKRAVITQGATWQEATETTLLHIPETGELLALIRNDATVAIEVTRSSDMGATWSTPETVMTNATGLPRMTRMPDGTILATLRGPGTGGSGGQEWMLGESTDNGHTWQAYPLSDGWMMYGQIIAMTENGTALLVGSSQRRGSTTNADVWVGRLTVRRTGGVNAIDHYLSGPVVDARLELTSTLGGDVLATLTPGAGTIAWDSTERRGRLDVDVIADPVLHPRHPVANLGQVLVAHWVWPDLGISVPCGFWLVSEPAERAGNLWQVSADPEGPARLARAGWWTPGGKVITGTMASQVAQMLTEARVPWVPTGTFDDHGAPATECAPGDNILDSIQKVLDHADVEMRPDRHSPGVLLARRHVNVTDTPDWVWSDQDPRVSLVTGSHPTDDIPNRVTVWWEKEEDGVREVGGWSEPLYTGPRRWGGPYGHVPHVVKLDAPAYQATCQAQAMRMLADFQHRAATVRVEMRADPRIEVGDTARVVSDINRTDCFGRVSSVQLDAGTGRGVVECAVLTGTVAGVPATYAEIT